MSLPFLLSNTSWYGICFSMLLTVFKVQESMGQTGDTTAVYLDENLLFSNKKNSYFPAIRIKQQDHWKLIAVYPDTSKLLEAMYADAPLRWKDGLFTLYHPNRVKAMEGSYKMNVQEGVWRYWHPNGVLKDSGTIDHDILTGEWRSFDTNGHPQTVATYISKEMAAQMAPPQKPSNYAPSVFAKDTLTKILDGPYTSYYANSHIKEKGNYQQNTRNGPWTTYYPSGMLESKGTYTMDQQTGDWTYFFENGVTSTKEHYQNNQITSLDCFDSTGRSLGNYCSIIKPPVPLLSRFENFKDHLLDHIFWPKELSDKNVSGIVWIRCTIDKTGKLTIFEVVQSPHELLSKEVERYFKSIEEWSPAISHNRPITYTFEMEIPFIR